MRKTEGVDPPDIPVTEQELADYPGRDFNPFDLYVPTDPLMAGPWYTALRVTLNDPKTMKVFTADTGLHYHPASTVIEQMIDEACGVDERYLLRFCAWFNENVWGDPRLDHNGCIDGVKQSNLDREL